jgi:hypothetical protein
LALRRLLFGGGFLERLGWFWCLDEVIRREWWFWWWLKVVMWRRKVGVRWRRREREGIGIMA